MKLFWSTAPMSNVAEGQEHFDRLVPTTDLMVQPFMASVETEGERSLMFIDGEFTHAVRRPSMLTQEGAKGFDCSPVTANADEQLFAVSVLRQVESRLLYARVGLVRD